MDVPKESAGKMEKDLLENIQSSVSEIVPKGRIGIAFSGGVDSTLLSKVCSDMGYDITLLTIGFTESHDILFAGQVNEYLNYPHYSLEIDSDTFSAVSSKVCQIVDMENLSWNENCIAFYYVAKLARDLRLDTVVTANGIDELFCGYNAYREVFIEGESRISEVMSSKIDNELEMMKAVNLVASEFRVGILQPLLSSQFIEYALGIPVSEKIHGPDDLYRKHIVRRLADHVGVPYVSCTKRKKALQYGSRIHKALLNTR